MGTNAVEVKISQLYEITTARPVDEGNSVRSQSQIFAYTQLEQKLYGSEQ
jgi:hypothetical protein